MTIDDLKDTLTGEVEALKRLITQLENAQRQAGEELLVARGRLGQTQAIIKAMTPEEVGADEDSPGTDTEE